MNDADRSGRSARSARSLAAASVALVLVPIAVAATRGVRGGWIPIGDNAFFAVRARDVFTSHHPLVGTWTSASLTVGRDINNPGPLFFDLLALPAKLGGVAGLAIGVAILNAACVIGIAFTAGRRAGPIGTAAAMFATGALVWSMGSELLYDPWQPNALLLPFLLLLTLVWSALQGVLSALPWIVAISSVIVQTHFSYAVLIGVLAAVALGGLAATVIRGRRHSPAEWPHRRRRSLGTLALSAAVGLAAWAQPLIDQFDDGGHGNLVTLLTNAGKGQETIGREFGTRLVASILAVPPFWGRPSYETGLAVLGPLGLPRFAASVAALVVLLGVLAGVAALAFRRRDTQTGSAAGLGVIVVVAAWGTAVIIPVGVFAVAPHQFRWLWPIGAFTLFAVVLAVARGNASRLTPSVACAALTAAVAVLAAFALPTYNVRSGPTAEADQIPAARRLLAQLGPLEGKGPVVLDTNGIRFEDPYSLALMVELQRRDIEFRVEDSGMVHQLGPSRAADGSEEGRIVQRDRDDVFVTPPGTTLVARVLGLSPAERAERDQLRAEISGYIETRGLQLNAAGRSATMVDKLADFGDPGAVLRQPEPFVRGDDFVLLVRRDLAPIEPAWRARFQRYSELLERWQKNTVALFWMPS